jgi:hypothetical protein
MSDMIINIAKDFYPRPAGRYSADGEYTGQAFRENLLKPKLKAIQSSTDAQHLIIDFSDVTMAGSSFLEEAFGGLVRHKDFSKEFLKEFW